MKIWGNWGLGVAVFLVLFVISNIVFLIIISSQNFDMVEDNYYDKGINYQLRIDNTNRAKRLNDPIKVKKSGDNTLEFDYPYDLMEAGISGKIMFYRPADRANDFEIEILPDSNFKQYFDYTKIKRGIWVLKVSWFSNDVGYYYEEELVL